MQKSPPVTVPAGGQDGDFRGAGPATSVDLLQGRETEISGVDGSKGVPERGRSVVKRHGGTVTFETETGKGMTFIIRLPIAGQRGGSQNKEAQK